MSLDSACLAQLKLRQPPFDAVPSEEFLYSDPLLESLVETAARALHAPGAVVILAGAPGSGRSIQLMRLLGALAEGFELIAFRGRLNIPFDAVDVTIRNYLREGGFDDPSRSLTDLLAERSRAGNSIVLAIDDAHLLGMESIRQLLRMRSAILEAAGRGLRLILVGDQALSRGRLPLPDPADESQIVRLNLRPFNLEQAGAYLRHRLRVAGIEEPESFLTSGDIAVLQTSSKGIPAALNTNANAWLLRRCKSATGFRQAITGKISHLVAPSEPPAAVPKGPETHAVPVIPDPPEPMPEGILDFEIAEDSYQPSDPQLSDFLVQEDRRSESVDLEQVLRHVRQHQLAQQQPESKPELRPEVTAKPEPASAQANVPYWNRRWFMPVILVMVVSAIAVPVAFQLWGGGPPGSPDEAASPRATPAENLLSQSKSAQLEPSSPAPPTPEKGGAAPTQPAPATAGPPAESDESKGSKEPPKEAPAKAEAPAVAEQGASKPEAGKDASPAETSKVGPDSEDQAWLIRQAPERFTIQLVAARDLQAATEFLKGQEVAGVRFVRTRSLVIGVVGSFPSRAAAKQTLAELPAAVRSNGPWVRTIGSVLESQR